jgi:hypothetical protein
MVLGGKPLISEVVLSQLVIRLLLPPLGIDRCIRQAMGVLLGHLSSFTRLHKLTLEKDDLLNKALCILTSRGQRCDTPPPLSTPSLEPPLCQGSPVLCILDKSHDTILCISGLLSRSL